MVYHCCSNTGYSVTDLSQYRIIPESHYFITNERIIKDYGLQKQTEHGLQCCMYMFRGDISFVFFIYRLKIFNIQHWGAIDSYIQHSLSQVGVELTQVRVSFYLGSELLPAEGLTM
jgi:hypothetical protein